MSTGLLLVQTLNGLQFGILLFLVAAGLTLVFGVMDFINLAHGVQYMVGAYFAATFTALTGNLFLGLLLTLPAALAFGLLLEVLIFRHLYDRDHLEQVLATFGLILFLNQGVKLVWGAAPLSVPVPEILSGSILLANGILYPVYRIAIIIAGLATALLLYVLTAHTRIGMLVRAGASNAAMVSALGVDIRRLFMIVFGFGAMLAGFAGAMIAPILSVEPGMGDNLLILTFVVIVIGGIGSIRGAFIAALLIGLIDTLGRSFGPQLLRYVMDPASASQTGRSLAPMLIYILMAAVLFVRPAGLFPGQAMTGVRSFQGRGVAVLFSALALVPVAAWFGPESYILSVATRVVVFAIAAVSLDLILGYGALVSLGHAAFLGIGAYAVGIMSSHGITDLLAQTAVALGAAALFAFTTGALSLRTAGVYYIMISLAFGQMLFFFAVSLSAYGGDDGLTLSSRSTVFGFATLKNNAALYYIALATLAGIYAASRAIVGSRFGRVLIGTRENPDRMRAIGFEPFRYQLTAYVISGMMCALAGVLLANQSEFVSPAYMTWQRSGELLIMVILGGVGTLYGPIIGACAFLLLEDGLSGLTEHWKMIFGPLLILVVLFGRGGIAGIAGRMRRRAADG